MDFRGRLAANLKCLLAGKRQKDVEARTKELDPEGKGVVQQIISDMMNNCYPRPRVDMLELLAAALEVDITDLLTDPEAHPEEPDVRVRVLQKRVSELAAQNRELFLNLEGLVRTLVKNIQP